MKKQDDMRSHYKNKIKFYLGDVRDRFSVDIAMRNVDFVFHAAAYKTSPHVNFIQWRLLIQIFWANNVISSAIKHNVKSNF